MAEVIADSCQSMLTDPDVWNKRAETKATDKNLLQKAIQKIIDFFKDIAEKLRGLLSDGYFAPDTAEGKMFSEMADAAEQARDLWVKGFNAVTQSKTR